MALYTDELDNFFLKYCYEKRVLDPNPGCDVMSGIWIENSYGLRPEWRRQARLIAGKIQETRKVYK